MKAKNLYSPGKIHLYDGKIIPTDVLMVNETKLAVYLNQSYITTLSASPGAERELAVGYLLSEGIIGVNSQLVSLEYSPGQVYLITCEPSPEVNGTEGVALNPRKTPHSIDPEGKVVFQAKQVQVGGRAQSIIDFIHNFVHSFGTFATG
jgi:formate dehydrogenase assembly factor FdhD